jgi:hypothetical protein
MKRKSQNSFIRRTTRDIDPKSFIKNEDQCASRDQIPLHFASSLTRDGQNNSGASTSSAVERLGLPARKLFFLLSLSPKPPSKCGEFSPGFPWGTWLLSKTPGSTHRIRR